MLGRFRIVLLGALAHILLRLLYASFRLKRAEIPSQTEAEAGARPAIFAFWHNRQLLMPWLRCKFRSRRGQRKLWVLGSAHADGRIIAVAVKPFGIGSVIGSSSRGGFEGFMGLVEALEKGDDTAITPDGPRGPMYKSKLGAIKLAQLSGAPLVPLAYGARSCWRFKSWDRMILPKPFASVFMIMGDPILVPAELSAEEEQAWRKKLDEALCAVTERADALAASQAGK